MKKEEKIVVPEINKEVKEPNQMIIVFEHRKSKSRFLDSIKFGAGFYIGFKLARTAKYALIKIATKK